MKVLVTGSQGFIGSVIRRKLISQGHDVLGIDKRSGDTAQGFFACACGDDFDLVIHCAAVVGGRKLVESPVAHAENLEIDAGLFRWAEKAKPSRIVYVSSVAAYPARYQQWPGYRILFEEDIDWDDLQVPDQLYGWAKLTGEYMASRCSVPVSIPRLFTVYGGGQDHVFPFGNLVRQLENYHDPVTVWGTGNQVRDFIHVEDVAAGILAMAAEGIDGPVNFCTGEGTSLIELACKMIAAFPKMMAYSPQLETIPGPEGLPYRVGNPGKLHEFHKPRIALDEGIRKALR